MASAFDDSPQNYPEPWSGYDPKDYPSYGYGKGFDIIVEADNGGDQVETPAIVAGLTADNVLDTGETQVTSGLPTALVVLGAVGVAGIFAWWYYR